MASLGESFRSPLGTSTLRPHSYSAVESYLSADSSISSSSASCSSSSTSTIASSSSSTSTLTPPEPVSATSGGGSIPLWKTLVRPRRWRFVHRSRSGGSLDREQARQEDTSLDGDDDPKDIISEAGSSLDGDTSASSEKLFELSGKKTGPNGVGESSGVVDSANRTKSESDIAARRTTSSAERRPLGFKTRAERFSLQDGKTAQPRSSAMTRSQTLPPTGRSTLSPAAKSQSLPRGPILVDSSKRSRSGNRADGPKTVKFSESDNVELSPTKSDSSSNKSDSPSRNVTMNVQESTVRVSFSKPAQAPKAAASEKPGKAGSTVKTRPSAEKPDVPAKPSRLVPTSNGPVSGSRPLTSSSAAAKPVPSPAVKTDAKGSKRTSSSGEKSPKTPTDDEAFSTRVTSGDEAQQDSRSDAAVSKPLVTQDIKPKTVNGIEEKPSEDIPDSIQLKNGVGTDRESPEPQREDIVSDNLENHSDLKQNHDGKGSKEDPPAEPEVLQPSPVAQKPLDIRDDPNKGSKPKDKEIVPKKMIKIKGDKKAEEKAAKAKKKEQKAKEKELKAKKKTSPDTPDQEKGRIKLFPWKVEFSSKDKSQTTDTGSSLQKNKDSSNRKKKEPKKGKLSGKELSVPSASSSSSSGVQNGVHTGQDGESEDRRTAPSKKTDRTDGATTSSSSSKNHNNIINNNNTDAFLHDARKDATTPEGEEGEEGEGGDGRDEDEEEEEEDEGVVELLQERPPLSPPLHPLSDPPRPSSASSSRRSTSPPPPHLQQPYPHSHHHPHPHHHHHHHQQYQQQQQQQLAAGYHHHPHPQLPPRQPTPQPRLYHNNNHNNNNNNSSFDDVSSSDPNSDLDSWYGSLPRRGGLGPAGRNVRIYESDGEAVPEGQAGHGAPRRRAQVPRRHTVGGAQIQEHMQLMQDTDRKREAFYEMLATRYPQYADKITGLSAYHSQPSPAPAPVPVPVPAPERNSRPREPQRRRTAVPAFSHYAGRSMDYDDPGTMSDIELSSFQRGGYARASMPIVRSASTSLERPIGLVFLVYRDETKKALLPNEITSLDTVRALFVRAFPDKLSMDILDSPKRKIYILEAATSIFFQLEDLRDIKDRTVLKIHECDSDEPQHVRYQIEIRGRSGQPGRPIVPSQPGMGRESSPAFAEEMVKAHSLPVSATQNYQEMLHKERLQWEMEQEYLHEQLRRSRSRSLTPDPAERPRSLSAGPPRGRYSHSPERLPTPERGLAHLNPIPENPRLLANGFRQAAVNGGHYEMGGQPPGQPHTGQTPPPLPGRVVSPPPAMYDSVYPPGGYPPAQAFISHSTRAPAAQGPMRATGPPPHEMRGNGRGGPPQRQSLPFAGMSNPIYDSFPQRTQSYRTTPERDVLPPRPQSATSHDTGRMERMEAQIASLAAWVHQVQASPAEGPPARRNSNRSTSSGMSEGTDTYPASSSSKQNGNISFSTLPGLSDIPSSCSQPQAVIPSDMRDKINDMRCRMQELRVELQGLRRMEQLNQEAMKDAFTDTLSRIKKVISAVPGAEDQVVRQQRFEVTSLADVYRQDKAKVEKELSDLESSVEELKQDVLARKCRVNISDVEGLALMLSNITKSLADLKARFPEVQDSLKKVMAREMEIVVKEEKFIKEEPQQIEAALKRCKKLTSTLYTLKRLATVQDTRPLQVPPLALESREVGEEEKMAILENIRAMVPDHETRVQSLEVGNDTSLLAADASRERKKKIVTQHESLKFTKSLQTASKSLRPAEQQKDDGVSSAEKDAKVNAEAVDVKRSEPPVIPAKPARLMLSDFKHTSSAPSSSPNAPITHTVTVTSQISGDREPESKGGARSSARSVFFSSLESPTHPGPDRSKAFIETSPTLTMSPPPSSSQTKPPVSHSQAAPTARRSSASGIPQPKSPADTEDADKGRKVPPPPPPRRSSARYPYGIGPLSPQSPVESGGVGGPAKQRRNSGEKSPDKVQHGGMSLYKAHSPSSPATSGPLSSTPKPPTPQKPQNLSKLHKGGLKRSSLQHQRVGPDRMFTTFIPPVPAQVSTNSQDLLDEGDLSGSESTGSTTSLDSQQGGTLVRTNSTPPQRGPKPSPPQRCSSLSGEGRTKSHVVEVKRPLQVGTMTVQVNGLDGAAASGHKT